MLRTAGRAGRCNPARRSGSGSGKLPPMSRPGRAGSRRLWLTGAPALGWLVLAVVALAQAARTGGAAWVLAAFAGLLVLVNGTLFVRALRRRR